MQETRSRHKHYCICNLVHHKVFLQTCAKLPFSSVLTYQTERFGREENKDELAHCNFGDIFRLAMLLPPLVQTRSKAAEFYFCRSSRQEHYILQLKSHSQNVLCILVL